MDTGPAATVWGHKELRQTATLERLRVDRQLEEALGHEPDPLHLATESLGRPSDLRADLAGPVLDALRWAYPYRLGTLARSDGDGVTIGVSGPIDRVWHLAAHQRRWRFVSQPARQVVVVLEVTTEQAWRLLTNNLPAEACQDLRVSGDESVIQTILQARAIIGVPN